MAVFYINDKTESEEDVTSDSGSELSASWVVGKVVSKSSSTRCLVHYPPAASDVTYEVPTNTADYCQKWVLVAAAPPLQPPALFPDGTKKAMNHLEFLGDTPSFSSLESLNQRSLSVYDRAFPVIV